jgi:hypothetical protein
VRSGSLYPTLVDVGRALVARTQTLVWAKRLNFPGGNGFGTCNFTAERGGLSSTLLRFRRTEAPQHRGGLAPREAFGMFLGDHFIPVGKMGVGADEEPAHENGRGTDERSITGFDPSATRTGALRQWCCSAYEPRKAAYPAIHYNCTSCRKDWLSVRKEALVSLSDGAASARDPTAPSALTDPGLVLVRGPDRPDL